MWRRNLTIQSGCNFENMFLTREGVAKMGFNRILLIRERPDF